MLVYQRVQAICLCHKNDDLGGGNDLDDQIVIRRGSLVAK